MTGYTLPLVLVILTACAGPTTPIEGNWMVDHEATLAMATAKDATWLNRTLRPLTDGLKVEFSTSTVRVIDGAKEVRSSPYTVVEATEDGLVLLIDSDGRNHRVTVVLRKNRMVLAENDRAVVLRR